MPSAVRRKSRRCIKSIFVGSSGQSQRSLEISLDATRSGCASKKPRPDVQIISDLVCEVWDGVGARSGNRNDRDPSASDEERALREWNSAPNANKRTPAASAEAHP